MNNIIDIVLIILIIIICVFIKYPNLLNYFLGVENFQSVDKSNKLSKLNKKKLDNKSIIKKNKKINKKKVRFEEDLVYLDIAENNKKLGRIIIKLFSDIVPITCKNFRELCIYKKYKSSIFHRIIKDFMIQGGDYTHNNGTGGKSIYNYKFKDENFKIPHDRPYLLSMANAGPNTNGSQFFITTNKTPHLNNKHVVFGCIYDGFELIDYLNNTKTDDNDKPINEIKIINCGKFN